MIFSKLKINNWRNFKSVDVELHERVFLVGPNASGKSNLLDVFRFLRDIARSGGGLQKAVEDRGGVSKIRCLSARTHSDIEIEVHLAEPDSRKVLWKYAIGFTQTGGGIAKKRAKLKFEKVWRGDDELILNRPGPEDQQDEKQLEYTHIEQPTANSAFRDIVDFFEHIQYMHLLPQTLRESRPLHQNGNGDEDISGRHFIERISTINTKTRQAYLRKIEDVLRLAVPQFEKLELVKDDMGAPHLQTIYKHWRPRGAKQWEDQFSDGTLRLIGFFWALQDGTRPILFEEPELSLHAGIVSRLAEVIAKLQQKKSGMRQVILTTHSQDLLSNPGIAGEEVLMLMPGNEGTVVQNMGALEDVAMLLQEGMSVGDIAIPRTMPRDIHELSQQF